MKILLANKFYYPRGGDCIHTMQLQKLLEKNGHKTAVFSMQYNANIESKDSKYWPSEVSFTSQKQDSIIKTIARPFGVKEVKEKWLALINDFKPDIVHLHNIHSQLSPVIAQLAKEKGIPVFWTLHDYKLLCPASAFLDNENNVCDSCMHSDLSVVKKRCIKGSIIGSTLGYLEAKKWSLKKLQHFTTTFIAPSDFLRQKMLEARLPNHKIVHLCNFTDNIKFEADVNLNRSGTILYVGRISIEKGVDTLCKAVQSLGNVKLKIIGDGPLKSDLCIKYTSENIQFLGFQPWEVIEQELSESAFMVLPSQWFENNPLTIIEAFALGTPVLGSNIGGIPELIHQANGMVFNPGDVNDLAEKIKLMSESFWDYAAIRKQAKYQFEEERYYTKLINIYKENNAIC